VGAILNAIKRTNQEKEEAMNKHIHFPALAFGAGLLLMPTLATAQNATVKVLSPATVVAKGAGAMY
jgi:hypothetical protein